MPILLTRGLEAFVEFQWLPLVIESTFLTIKNSAVSKLSTKWLVIFLGADSALTFITHVDLIKEIPNGLVEFTFIIRVLAKKMRKKGYISYLRIHDNIILLIYDFNRRKCD